MLGSGKVDLVTGKQWDLRFRGSEELAEKHEFRIMKVQEERQAKTGSVEINVQSESH